MITTKVWYKDGVLKKEETKTENGETKVYYTLINIKNKEKLFLYENTKEGLRKEYNCNEKIENEIVSYLIGSYYYKNFYEMFKDLFFTAISINDNFYIIEKNNKKYDKNVYNKESFFIEQSTTKNIDNEEDEIVFYIEINSINDENLNINLDEYNIINE